MPVRKLLLFPALALIALVFGAILLLSTFRTTPDGPSTGADLAQILGGTPPEGFARAHPPADIRLPRDHGPHPDFRTEWWYFTGHLTTVAEEPESPQRRFGYQLTFFRSALAPPSPGEATTEPTSPWATDQMFMAHFAVSDLEGGRFHHFERFARGALGLAGVEAAPFHVWVGPWSAASSGASGSAEDDIWPLLLQAPTPDLVLDLVVEPQKGVVLQGDAGYSRKGEDPGNASFYYSFPRLTTRGTLTLDGRAWQVTGSSWLDREWSTSALAPDQVGWDWFALQLDDEREIMLYQLRRRDGSVDPHSSGLLVTADGRTRPLGVEDFTIEVLDRRRAPDGGALYPSRWRVRVRTEEGELELEIRLLLADQELHAAVRYWEGAVEIHSEASGEAVGRGYVELTGYGRPP